MTTAIQPKRRKIRHAKAFGYILDSIAVFDQAVRDGTTTNNQLFATFTNYGWRIAEHCGIKFDDIIPVYSDPPGYNAGPVCCVVVATNLSNRSMVPRIDIINKAKEFLGTTEESKWCYIARD